MIREREGRSKGTMSPTDTGHTTEPSDSSGDESDEDVEKKRTPNKDYKIKFPPEYDETTSETRTFLSKCELYFMAFPKAYAKNKKANILHAVSHDGKSSR